MEICHFLLYKSIDPKFGGPTYSVPIQCIGTQREGAKMSFVVYEASKPYEQRLVSEGIKMIHIPNPQNKYQLLFATNLQSYLATCTYKPDILHFHGVWMPSSFYISKFGRKNNIPYVINPRGDTEIARIYYNKLKMLKKKIALNLYVKDMLDNAACVIATSEQEHDSIRALGCKVPIAIIPNGIEIKDFPQNIEHKYGNKKVILFLSRINPIKGIEFLIDAWSQLPNDLRNNWEIHIAGNSDPEDYIFTLKGKVKKLKLTDSIKFIGQITGEAKMRKYQDSNLFILPSLNENFGNVVAEAMMCECPVITTKNTPWSILSEEKIGWWVDLSVESLVNTLKESMLLSDEERNRLGKLSRQSIINKFSSSNIAKKTFILYEWILGKRDKPDFVKTLK